jgi:LCP family protein required for cell wall assembly
VSGRLGRADRRGQRGRRTWRERLLLGFSGGLACALLLMAGGLAYVYSKYSRLPRVTLGAVLTSSEDDDAPQNFLLVGVDSAANLAEDDPARQGRGGVGGLRSDTMMILRVEPGAEQASLLSLPRDLWVPLASGGKQRINSAIQNGGPGELVDTIEQYFGIPIHHYVQVDFAGFQELVEVIDGVSLYFPSPARDTRSGLAVESTGCVTLDGEQALGYVRSRHYERYVDGRWRTDPSGDLGRISRQQDFIIRALHQAVAAGARNPLTFDRLVDAGLATVTVDDLLTADDIIDLGQAFRSFDPGALDTYSLPTRAGSAGGAAILRLQDEEAQPILDRFRGTDQGELRPGDVRVLVLNGSGITGQAGQTSAALTAAGFGAAGTGEAERYDVTEPLVRYTAGSEAKADLVARHLDPSARLELVDGELAADVVVITGSLLEGVRTQPRPPGPSTTATTASTTTTTSPPRSTTTTTVVGYVPEAPEGVDC